MIRIGIIGCGRIAELRHIPECNENPEIEIAGYYNRTREKAEKMAKQYGGRVYDRAEECMLDPSVDAVIISTATCTHAPYTMFALCNGKHVICEKPMSISEKECLSMVDAAKDYQKILLIGYHERYTKTHQLAKKIIDEGIIGKVLTFQTVFAHGGPGKKRNEENLWFYDKKEAGGGVSIDLAVHKIDTIRYLLGQEIVSVTSELGKLNVDDFEEKDNQVEDNAIYILRTEHGAMGTVTASWTCYGSEVNSTRIFGDKGHLLIQHPYGKEVEVTLMSGEKRTYIAEETYRANGWTDSGVVRELVRLIRNQEIQTGEDAFKTMKVVLDGMK